MLFISHSASSKKKYSTFLKCIFSVHNVGSEPRLIVLMWGLKKDQSEATQIEASFSDAERSKQQFF